MLTLGHSPDADDAFMFYALAKGKVASRLRFEHVLHDIETLNAWAAEGKLDVTAVSAHAAPFVAQHYRLLDVGASVGDGYGPVVVSARPLRRDELRGLRVAVPGARTTALLAARLALPAFQEVPVPFDRVLESVRSGECDAGIVIHEGQLTFSEQRFHAVLDLGAWWREETGLPLPLGLNAVHRRLSQEDAWEVREALKRSIEHALSHRAEALDHALAFARGLPREMADRFVGMYVNRDTVQLSDRARDGLRVLLERAVARGLVPRGLANRVEFLPPPRNR